MRSVFTDELRKIADTLNAIASEADLYGVIDLDRLVDTTYRLVEGIRPLIEQ